MTESDIAYFRRRGDEERQRADTCADPAIALVHRRLADHYTAALAAAGAGPGISAVAAALA